MSPPWEYIGGYRQTGRTTQMLRLCAEAIREGKTCLWTDFAYHSAEYSFHMLQQLTEEDNLTFHVTKDRSWADRPEPGMAEFSGPRDLQSVRGRKWDVVFIDNSDYWSSKEWNYFKYVLSYLHPEKIYCVIEER